MNDQPQQDEPLIKGLHSIISICVRALSILMTLVIAFGVLDVMWVIYNRLSAPPYFLMNIGDILATFSAFMAVLIAIEIFINIKIYLRDDIIHVRIVMATALMAIARKVIVLDFKSLEANYIWAVAGVVLAMSIGYWLVSKTAGINPRKLTCEEESEPAPSIGKSQAKPD